MLPSASALASRREERVQKAFFVDHHGPGDARLSHSAAGIYGESGDYVVRASAATHSQARRAVRQVSFVVSTRGATHLVRHDAS